MDLAHLLAVLANPSGGSLEGSSPRMHLALYARAGFSSRPSIGLSHSNMEKQLKLLVLSPRSLSLNKVCGKGESLFSHRSHSNLDSSYILPQTGYLHPPCSYFSVSATKAPGRSESAQHVNQICLSASADPRDTVGAAVVLAVALYGCLQGRGVSPL